MRRALMAAAALAALLGYLVDVGLSSARNLALWRRRNASTICCPSPSAVGCRVTANQSSCRRPQHQKCK